MIRTHTPEYYIYISRVYVRYKVKGTVVYLVLCCQAIRREPLLGSTGMYTRNT